MNYWKSAKKGGTIKYSFGNIGSLYNSVKRLLGIIKKNKNKRGGKYK